MLVSSVVRFSEIAAAEKTGSDGLEIARQDGAVIGHDGVLFFLRGPLFPIVRVPVGSLDQRKMRNGRHGLNARKGGDSFLQLVQHFIFGRGDLKAEDVFSTESGIDAKYVNEGSHQETSS